MTDTQIISAIDNSPLNRGLSGASWLAQPGNVAIVQDDDVTLFDHEGPGVFQVHFLFASRGKAAVASARESFRQMFIYRGADLIFGMVPDILPHAKLMARLVGGKSQGLRDTPYGPCELFVLSKEMWSAKCPS